MTDISKEAVERYEAYGHRGDAIMCKEADGSWVDYDDYKALKDAADGLADAVRGWFGNGQKSGELMEALDAYRKAKK